MLFTPLTLTSLSNVDNADAGLASSLINTGQVVGGSIGLAILGTVAWTVVVNTARNAAHVAGSAQVSISGHALGAEFSRGFEVSAAIMRVLRTASTCCRATWNPALLDSTMRRSIV